MTCYDLHTKHFGDRPLKWGLLARTRAKRRREKRALAYLYLPGPAEYVQTGYLLCSPFVCGIVMSSPGTFPFHNSTIQDHHEWKLIRCQAPADDLQRPPFGLARNNGLLVTGVLAHVRTNVSPSRVTPVQIAVQSCTSTDGLFATSTSRGVSRSYPIAQLGPVKLLCKYHLQETRLSVGPPDKQQQCQQSTRRTHARHSTALMPGCVGRMRWPAAAAPLTDPLS